MIDSKLLARAAVAEPDWYQLEGEDDDFIDFDRLRAHVTAAIDTAVERAARACDAIAAESGDRNAVRAARKCAAAIRSP